MLMCIYNSLVTTVAGYASAYLAYPVPPPLRPLHHQGRAFRNPIDAIFDVDKTRSFHFIASMSSILVPIYIIYLYLCLLIYL